MLKLRKYPPKGFTLIELLVVVLIIGILAAIALPQYQIAVKKATLSKYMAIVKAMKEAQDRYFLANGIFASDVDDLDISLPINDSCSKSPNNIKQNTYYDCGKDRFGIFSQTNAQAGDNTIRYLQFFDEATTSGGGNFQRGDIACYAKGETSRKACQSLGQGEERVYNGSSWDYVYIARSSSNN